MDPDDTLIDSAAPTIPAPPPSGAVAVTIPRMPPPPPPNESGEWTFVLDSEALDEE